MLFVPSSALCQVAQPLPQPTEACSPAFWFGKEKERRERRKKEKGEA